MDLPDIRKNVTYLGVERGKSTMRDLAADRKTIGLVCGGAGCGKNVLPRKIAKQHRIGYVPEDRPDNAAALVSMTWQNRDRQLHILNECNHLMRDPEAMNVLKLMHEPPRRCVSFTKEARRNEDFKDSGSVQYRESIAPTSFNLDDPVRHRRYARQLFTMNMNYTDPEVTRRLPQDHWIALLRRGLDPVFIPTPDPSLFQYTIWLGGEGRMLSDLQFDYATSRDAMNFYINNANRLPEITPARLVMLAEIIRDNSKDRAATMLDQMLTLTDQRDLGLATGQVQVLLWPRRPKRTSRPAQQATAAPEHKPDEPVSHPQPVVTQPEPITVDPEPEPIIDEAVVADPIMFTVAAPVADPEPEPSIIDEPIGEPRTWDEAVDLIYRRRQSETCETVAEALHSVPMRDWEQEDFDRLKEMLDGCAEWFGDHNGMVNAFFLFETSPILFGTAQGVLIVEDGLKVLSWLEAMERIAPQLKADKERRDRDLREAQVRQITHKTLPAKRKLKVVKALIDELIALQVTFQPDGVRAVEFIRGLSRDDERFADCATWNANVTLAGKLSEPEPKPSVLRLPAPNKMAPTD